MTAYAYRVSWRPEGEQRRFGLLFSNRTEQDMIFVGRLSGPRTTVQVWTEDGEVAVNLRGLTFEDNSQSGVHFVGEEK
jgi:hypothetical protein